MIEDDVLYLDNHLLVMNKVAGLLTQPSGTEQENLQEKAKEWLKEKYGKPGRVFLEAVHRIDKPVSGVVLFARTSKALSRLQKLLREGDCKKSYWALVEGVPLKDSGTLEHYLIHGKHRASVVKKDDQYGKFARLHYRVCRRFKGKAFLSIDLETGRYHQIRVQLSAWGYPIIGDRKYGASDDCDGKKIALHHRSLEIFHPVGGTELKFIAEPSPQGYFCDLL